MSATTETMVTKQEDSAGLYLVVGSLRTAQDQTYFAVVERLEKMYGKSRVEKHLWDRIIGQAAQFTPQRLQASHVILVAEDIQGWTLQQLLKPIQDATAKEGSLDISIAGMDSAHIKSELEQSGFEVVASGSGVSAKKRAPVSTDEGNDHSVPLRRLRRSGDAKTKAKLWALSAPTDDAELIDEEALLTEEDRLRPTLTTRPDCDVKRTRKACKNCTCGLRELELELEEDLPGGAPRSGGGAGDGVSTGATQGGLSKAKVRSGAVTSSCGSCYLGDAFRCSGCPYLGLPAFEPGQRVQLTDAMGDDV